MLALSLDLGGTHIGGAVVRDKELQGSSSLDSAQSLESLLSSVAAELRKILHACSVRAEGCHGMVIGFPGIVDARHGRILSTLKKFEARFISISSNGQKVNLDLAFGWKMTPGWHCSANNTLARPKG